MVPIVLDGMKLDFDFPTKGLSSGLKVSTSHYHSQENFDRCFSERSKQSRLGFLHQGALVNNQELVGCQLVFLFCVVLFL